MTVAKRRAASRVLAVAALPDVLTAFDAKDLPSAEELEASVSSDLQTLQGLQNDDGGFPYWRHRFESIPFNTIHVAQSLYRADQEGIEVSMEIQEGALSYVKTIETHYPYWYCKQTRWNLSAYALYVRNLYGDHDVQKAQSLLNEAGLENLSMEALGWWWWGTWYEHQNLRDDEAEAFTSLLWDGVYEYTYIAHATTPGTLIVPPTKVEEMYSPEMFGRSRSDWVIVE